MWYGYFCDELRSAEIGKFNDDRGILFGTNSIRERYSHVIL